MADNTDKLVTLSNLSEHVAEIKRLLKQVRAYIDKKDDTKVDKVSGKQLSTNDYTTTEKNKLAGIAAGANNYSHPAYTVRTGVPTADAKPGFGGTFQVSQPVSDGQGHITAVNPRTITIPNAAATTSAPGLMSSTDKTKLDGIEAGAQKNTVTGIKGNAESSYRTGNVNLTPANIGAAAASHTHSIGNVTNLQAALDGKAASSHTHAISNITNLQTTLDGKAAKSHTHSASEITSGTLSIDRIADKSITKEKLADGIFTETDNILISTIYIDQNITDPASMISGDINGAAIQAIRANSHRYLGKYTAENTMTICQLLDANSKLFHDSTAADLTGSQGDVFMRLPIFYTQATEIISDLWQIRFAFGGKPEGERWMQWGGNDLIGVYEAYHSSSKIYSRSGVTPLTNISQADFKTYARNRGNGFTLVKHKHQNIMAFLFYALYGNTNSQEICGYGTDNYPETAGGTNSLGMTDTTSANGNSMSINFWGLENWWGDIFEWEDNIIYNSNIWNITEDDGTTRQVTCYAGTNNWYYPQKFVIGDNLDTIMKPGSSSGSASIGYCDGHYLSTYNSMVVRRSGTVSNGAYGLVCVNAAHNFSYAYSDIGSRLAFFGNIIEEKNTETYKSLTAIG